MWAQEETRVCVCSHVCECTCTGDITACLNADENS